MKRIATMTKNEFERRRKQLMEHMEPRSIAILPTAPVRARNRDVEFPFRPDSDFMYVTGFPEPEAVAVLKPGRDQGAFVLFCREKDVEMEQWHGFRAGLEGACEQYGADDAFPSGDLDDILPGLMEGCETVYYAMGYYPEFDQHMLTWVNRLRSKSRSGPGGPAEFVALDHVLHEMRLFKSREEIKTMSHAMAISARAHERAMRQCHPGLTEFQVEAELLYEFTRAGSRFPAYPSIVAGGANACVLHYVENTATVKDGDLLLIDAGAEYDCYASDITRTFPVGGRFTPEQREVYDIVLAAQKAAIAAVKPGNTCNDPHDAAVRVIVEGLLDIGLLKGKVSTNIEKEKYRKFYMHRTGHWLGMDVHDVGDYRIGGEWRVLEPGMVTTIEPGLYIGTDRGIPKKYRNIGVRIEDDVLVTRDGQEVLSAAAPKEPEALEALVGAG
jgi:Xaa-Pro aminopeptidase